MIRWITKTLATGSWEEVKDLPNVHVADVRDMVDKEGNPASLVKSKIEGALSFLTQGKSVVLACDYGISRRNAIAAGVSCEMGTSAAK